MLCNAQVVIQFIIDLFLLVSLQQMQLIMQQGLALEAMIKMELHVGI